MQQKSLQLALSTKRLSVKKSKLIVVLRPEYYWARFLPWYFAKCLGGLCRLVLQTLSLFRSIIFQTRAFLRCQCYDFLNQNSEAVFDRALSNPITILPYINFSLEHQWSITIERLCPISEQKANGETYSTISLAKFSRLKIKLFWRSSSTYTVKLTKGSTPVFFFHSYLLQV